MPKVGGLDTQKGVVWTPKKEWPWYLNGSIQDIYNLTGSSQDSLPCKTDLLF